MWGVRACKCEFQGDAVRPLTMLTSDDFEGSGWVWQPFVQQSPLLGRRVSSIHWFQGTGPSRVCDVISHSPKSYLWPTSLWALECACAEKTISQTGFYTHLKSRQVHQSPSRSPAMPLTSEVCLAFSGRETFKKKKNDVDASSLLSP